MATRASDPQKQTLGREPRRGADGSDALEMAAADWWSRRGLGRETAATRAVACALLAAYRRRGCRASRWIDPLETR